MASKEIKSVIKQFKSALAEEDFPPVRVMIYGSYARNEARRDSDIDLCLISKAFKPDEKEQYRKRAVFIAFRVDPRIQVVLAHPDDLKNTLSPLFSQIRKEAVEIK